ncbi:MAG: MocR-like pyridoxine biosynthesis transcription factor PdxR [Chthoniobacterales bacterium]
MIRLNRAAGEPLHQQLYRQIRDELEKGSFDASASRLPSSRALAADLGISRLTVNLAFAKLHDEGYLHSKKGSGTFVAERLPKHFFSVATPEIKNETPRPPEVARRVSEMSDPRTTSELNFGAAGPPNVSFSPGLPAIDEFPVATWERLRSQVLAKRGTHLLNYASSRGDLSLRKAIATYLCDSRGARCHHDQIVVVAGMQHAMLVSTMALVNPGEAVWTEDPGYHQARRVFVFAGAKVVPRPIDDEGLVLAPATKRNAPKLIYLTPSHQFPLGVTMSLPRRIAMIDFARKFDSYILEDDYNAEFRFDGPPLPALQGLDNARRVIYAGTLSKILVPSIRLGYLLVPEQIVDSFVKVRAVMDQHSPSIDQATLAKFITEGFFISHVQRMRKIYADRREYFIEQFEKYLGKIFRLETKPAGLHFVAWLRDKNDFDAFLRTRFETDIRPSPLRFYCIEAQLPPAFVFGFAAWSRAQIREGLAKLATAFARLKAGGSRAPRALVMTERERIL